MNAHDSEKVVGTLLNAGLRAGRHARRGRTGALQHLQHPRQGRAEGLQPPAEFQARPARARSSACWAAWRSRRARRSSSAPRTCSLVAGSASYPAAGRDAGATGSGQPARHRPELRNRRDLRHAVHAPRQSAPRLHHHHRRLRQILRLLRGAVHARPGAQPHQRKRHGGSARTGRQGLHRDPIARPEREQLPRPFAGGLGFRHAAGARGRNARASGGCATPPATRAISCKRHRGRHGCQSGDLRPRAPAGAVRLQPRAGRHGPAVHARRIHAPHRVDEEREAPLLAHHRHHRGLSRARPTRISSRRSTCWTKCSTIRCSASSTRRARIPRRWPWTTAFPRRRSSAAC